MRITQRPIEKLVPYAQNARTHSEAQVAQLVASIEEFGWTNPVLVDGDNGIIAGHGRVMAALKLGQAKVPCIEIAHLTEEQRRADIIADNRLAENAGWDKPVLALELAELTAADFDTSLIGFDPAELDSLLAFVPPTDGLTDPDDIPAHQEHTISRVDDLWRIGRHRMFCGDSTEISAIARVMEGDRAALLFTSPPYDNQRKYTTNGIVDWDALMRGAFGQIGEAMAPDGQVLVNLGILHRDNEWQPYWEGWLEWMRSSGWRRFGIYVWDQGWGLPGRWNGRLAPSFELIFHFNQQAREPNKIIPCKTAGDKISLNSGLRGEDGKVRGTTDPSLRIQPFRIPDNVLRITRHSARGIEMEHPAVFPVALPEFLMNAYCEPGEIVFDPFAGSGTTLISGEGSGRPVRAIELAPEYVDVAVRRWQEFTGEAATLEGDGRAFDEIALERQEAA